MPRKREQTNRRIVSFIDKQGETRSRAMSVLSQKACDALTDLFNEPTFAAYDETTALYHIGVERIDDARLYSYMTLEDGEFQRFIIDQLQAEFVAELRDSIKTPLHNLEERIIAFSDAIILDAYLRK